MAGRNHLILHSSKVHWNQNRNPIITSHDMKGGTCILPTLLTSSKGKDETNDVDKDGRLASVICPRCRLIERLDMSPSLIWIVDLNGVVIPPRRSFLMLIKLDKSWSVIKPGRLSRNLFCLIDFTPPSLPLKMFFGRESQMSKLLSLLEHPLPVSITLDDCGKSPALLCFWNDRI